MAERPEDLNLPISVVQRIIKEALPDGVIVSREARQTISRAASVFVLYLTACAVTHSNKAKRKTLAVNDIISAMTDMEFESFIVPLNEALKTRKEALSLAASKKPAPKGKTSENVEEEAVDDGEPDVIEIEENEVAEIEEEDENEKSVSAKPTVKKRKLSEKDGDEKEKTTEEVDNNGNDDGVEEEEESDVEEAN